LLLLLFEVLLLLDDVGAVSAREANDPTHVMRRVVTSFSIFFVLILSNSFSVSWKEMVQSFSAV
jgi:hypothetical protein